MESNSVGGMSDFDRERLHSESRDKFPYEEEKKEASLSSLPSIASVNTQSHPLNRGGSVQSTLGQASPDVAVEKEGIIAKVKRKLSFLPGRKMSVMNPVKSREHYRRPTIILQRTTDRGQVQNAIMARLQDLKARGAVHRRSLMGLAVFAAGGT
jgi:hypothetical protein